MYLIHYAFSSVSKQLLDNYNFHIHSILCKTLDVYVTQNVLYDMEISGDIVYGTLLLLHRLYTDSRTREMFYRIILRNDISLGMMDFCVNAPLAVRYALEDHAKNCVLPRLITYADVEITIVKNIDYCVEDKIEDILNVFDSDLNRIKWFGIDPTFIFDVAYDIASANRDMNQELEDYLIENGYLSVVNIDVYVDQARN